jgi:hypothetical protein
MMLKRTIIAASIAALSIAGAAAQENATLTLKSGERIQGQLIDMGGSGFTIRVGGNERQVPTGEVALIDFAGSTMSQSDWDRVTSGQHVIWLRNGETLTGQLYDIGGTAPLRITVKADGSERELASNEVSRIAMARPSNISTGTTGSGGGGQSITVSAQQRWTPTGINVREGEMLRINAEGEIRVSPDSNDRATPHGVTSQRTDPRAPLPRTFAGALIGRIGNGEPFGIGASGNIRAPGSGQLFLGINDSNVSDNEGSFQVTVDRSPVPRR